MESSYSTSSSRSSVPMMAMTARVLLTEYVVLLFVLFWFVPPQQTNAFLLPARRCSTSRQLARDFYHSRLNGGIHTERKLQLDDNDIPTPPQPSSDPETTALSSYEDTDSTSRGLVSSLTKLVNSLSSSASSSNKKPTPDSSTQPSTTQNKTPPNSSQELMDRLEQDYTANNYLWTGQLDIACFAKDCRFTDPTLSFEGIDTFVTNTQNLVPLVAQWIDPATMESKLLSIDKRVVSPLAKTDKSNPTASTKTEPEGYIETRWNMIGDIPKLFWKPRIDVIGRTKFWYRRSNSEDHDTDALEVYEYDENWEIPAYQALLQIVTPRGSFPSSTSTQQ